MDFLAKEKGKARKPSVRRRSFEGGNLDTAHSKALLFGNMVGALALIITSQSLSTPVYSSGNGVR